MTNTLNIHQLAPVLWEGSSHPTSRDNNLHYNCWCWLILLLSPPYSMRISPGPSNTMFDHGTGKNSFGTKSYNYVDFCPAVAKVPFTGRTGFARFSKRSRVQCL